MLDGLLHGINVEKDDKLKGSFNIIEDAVSRLESGKPLGAKGLYKDLHLGVTEEFERRKSGLYIHNNSTNWIYVRVKRPNNFPTGVWIGYRIKKAIAEIRITKHFTGNRDALKKKCQPSLQPLPSGTQLFLRLPILDVSDHAKNGEGSESDIKKIVDACEWLADWWKNNYSDS